MERFKGLLRDTWWLWIGLFGMGIVLGLFFDKVFFIAIPIAIFAFFYFAFMRYDEDGHPVGEE